MSVGRLLSVDCGLVELMMFYLQNVHVEMMLLTRLIGIFLSDIFNYIDEYFSSV